MNSIAFSAETLTNDQALQIAEAYVRGDKDPPRMARLLGVSSFDLNLLMHPMVRAHIVNIQRSIRQKYSLDDHIDQLKRIRNAAFNDDNFKIALAAETQLGKAAGHYDPKPPGEDGSPDQPIDPTKLTTAELRRRLARTIGAVIPVEEEPSLPPPQPGEADALEDEDEVDTNQI